MTLIDRERLVCIGIVREPHGVKGELKVKPLTEDPAWYEGCRSILLDAGRGLRPFSVRGIRYAGRRWIFSLEGLDNREDAQALKGAEVLLDEADIKPLGAGEYFTDDLIGCELYNLAGDLLGRVKGLIETGANDVLEVTTEHGETLVPVTEEVVKRIDTKARRIEIDPLPGLFGPGR